MHPFKKMILSLVHENSSCESLISFDYKSSGTGGTATFRFKYCGDAAFSQFTFSGFADTGGTFFTYTLDPEVGDPVLCIEKGTFEWVSGSVSNTNNYVYGGVCVI